ncbi:hypothetical protein LTR91_004794 [Friedmanniomyces endolithicus]|uniref:SAC domain-containing protein n=1 Tax=Friedmanniomyces endolithicus TaxID=329885 RepID=A0AAN6KWI4_9PEZI|nr:hypothetical protein LTR57_001773 [Friedmanniomyces endolithicus]KAK1003003.1 hypothetical protein LTR91_004794 [Friedmanniomyces endolithicus]KAK1012891.1 hypothetical protein LTS01_000702 [Friedmanniomyces endolithicus]KAK1053500.1 hypothetical protein LTS16_001258 [Friedmanniomyces endolithicus]
MTFSSPQACAHAASDDRSWTLLMSQADGLAVPKFSSFRPKKTDPKDAEKTDGLTVYSASRSVYDASERSAKRRERHHEGDPHTRHDQPQRSGRRKDHYSQSRSRPDGSRADPLSSARDRSLHFDEPVDSDAFIVDRRGDPKNVEYGSLHRYGIPLFHRVGYGHVLGGSPTSKIDRADSSDRYIVLTSPSSEHREHSGSLLGRARDHTPSERSLRVIIPGAGSPKTDLGDDFLPLSRFRVRKRHRSLESPANAESQREDIDYRSIEGKAKSSDSPGDEDLEFAPRSGEDDLADRLSREALEENALLSRKTKEHPLDADAWMALIGHQAKVIKPGVDAAQLTNSEKRAIADIRLSISEQALRRIGNGSPGHTELMLGMLEQGKQIWESSKLTAKWTGVLKECPDNITLWITYLDFVQTNHAAFRYDQCKDAYTQCLQILREARRGARPSDTPKIASIQIYVLLRLTTFMRDAGYDELSYASWQALLEYQLFAPPGMTDRKDKLKVLEDFWDSDVPRIGEQGSQGWCHHLQYGERTARRVKSYARPILAPSHPLGSFADGETDLLSILHLPAVADDDDSTEDPYRYVMFSDLQLSLELLVDALPPRDLLSALLCFMHLPPMPGLDLATRAWWTDQFLISGAENIVAGDKDFAGIPNQLVTSFGLFHDAFRQRRTAVEDPEGLAFTDRILAQFYSAQPDDEDLAEYYVAYKLAFFPDEAVKAAKRLLKGRPSSLRRYNAYALVEAQLGRGERAAEVWATALNMSQDFENAEKDHEVLLRHSWASTLLHQEGGGPQALQCLLAMCGNDDSSANEPPENTTVSASQRLRMTRVCEAGFERLIYCKRVELAVLYAESQMWFAYLADGEDLTSATEVRRTYSARLGRHGLATAADEHLLQAQAGLSKMHVDRHRPYKPAVLRQELAENLRPFPDNTTLLGLYTHIGTQTRVDDRLRASLHEDPLTSSDATVIGWSFAIAQELRRCASSETSGATTNSVRSVFSHALLAPESLLKLATSSYLIAITGREQVAQIKGKPIYAIRDVTLVPLSSQADAERAVTQAQKALKPSGSAAQEAEESDVGEDAEHEHVGAGNSKPAAEVAALEPAKEGVLSKGASIVKGVVADQGKYGRFAERWFSKGGRSQQGAKGEEVLPQAQEKEADSALPDENEDVKTGAESGDQLPPRPTEKGDESGKPETSSQSPKKVDSLESLTPRILRSAKMYFSASGFFFSYDHNLSGSLKQNDVTAPTTPLWERFDPLFFWNRHLISPFVDAGQDGLILPIIEGFVGQRAFSIARTEGADQDAVAEAVQKPEEVIAAQKQTQDPSPATKTDQEDLLLTLISRRSVKRAGLRYLRRGIDDDGNVANSVETEQILSTQSWDTSTKTFSLTQIRGSIPLFFSQTPYSFKPMAVMFGSESTNQAASRKHFEAVQERYGSVQVASLIDKHATEKPIGEAYEKQVKQLNDDGGIDGKAIAFEWFDFHAACKGMKFENVSLLLSTLKTQLTTFGWTVQQNSDTLHSQIGVLRTNCMDCLDRTNVVQSAVAGWALQQQLAELGLSIDLESDPKTQWFNTLWADNGDSISKQYAGTAALKGDFTRTRKRNWTGALSDFSLTLNRYYNNIFGDYWLQLNIDFFLGNVGLEAFGEFEADMRGRDYALDMGRVRQSAIETCVKIVLEDPKEEFVGGWILACPREANTLRSLPFEECVVLLTDAGVYFCRFDWDAEKIGSFERVDLRDVREVWRGVYVTDTLAAAHVDEGRNVGFAMRFATKGQAVVRRNTRSVGNERVAEDEGAGKGELEKQEMDGKGEKGEKGEMRLLAFKALPPKSSASKSRGDGGDGAEGGMSEAETVMHICDELRRRMVTAVRKTEAADHTPEEKVPEVEERDVVSVAEARKGTGYIETLGYSLKKLVWS